MQRYECDPVYQICEGGFGGVWPVGYAFAVTGVPSFEGYAAGQATAIAPNGDVQTVNPDGSVSLYRPGGFIVNESPTQATSPVQTTSQPSQAVAEKTPSWLIPVLIIVVAVVLSK